MRLCHLPSSVAIAAVIVGTVNQGLAQEKKLVVPNSLANVEGDINGGASRDFRFQAIFNASEFESLGGDNLLTRWSFRPNSSTPAGHQISFDWLQVRLSPTQVSPGSISNTFANNITGAEVVVYDGPWSATTNSIGPVTGPKEFDIHIEFDEFFRYDRTEGNLLLDVMATGGAEPWNIDYAQHPSSRSSSIWSGDDAIDSPVATGGLYGPPPSQLTFVPNCDLNGDGVCDALDVDVMTQRVMDGTATFEDRTNFIEGPPMDSLFTYAGDWDSNGQFDEQDIVAAFTIGEYQTGNPVGFAGGDADGDFLFTEQDLVFAFTEVATCPDHVVRLRRFPSRQACS